MLANTTDDDDFQLGDRMETNRGVNFSGDLHLIWLDIIKSNLHSLFAAFLFLNCLEFD